MNDGDVKIGIEVEDKRAKKNLEQIKQDIMEVGNELSKTNKKKMTGLADEMEETSNNANKVVGSIQEVDSKIKDLQNSFAEMKTENANMLNEIIPGQTITYGEEYKNLLDQQLAKKKELAQEISSINEKQIAQNSLSETYLETTQSIKDKLNGVEETVSSTTEKTKGLKTETSKVKSELRKSDSNAKSMGKSISGGFKKILKYSAALFGIRTIYTGLKKLSREFFDSNDADVKQMKANMGALTNGLTQLLAPALKFIIGLVTTIMGYANAIAKAFFGVELFSKKTNKNVSGSAKGAKKLRKEVERISTAFDVADVASSNINDNLDTDSSGGGMDINDLPEPKIPVPDISGFLNAINKMTDKLKPFIDTIKSIDLKPLMDSFKNLGNATVGVFEVMGNSIINMMNDSLAPFIKMTTEEIAPRAINAVAEAIRELTPYLEYLLTNLVEPFVEWALTDLYPVFADTMISAFELLKEATKKILDGMIEWWEFIEPFFVWLGDFAVKALEGVSESIKELTGKVKDNEGGFGDLFKMIGIITGAFLTFLAISKLVGIGVAFFTGVIGALSTAFSFLLGIAKVVVGFFAGAFTGSILAIVALVALLTLAIVGIATNFEQVKNDMKQIVGNIIGVFKGLIDFVIGVFTGDWKRAFKGLADAVGNAFAGVVNMVKLPINIILDGVNAMIRGLNKVKIPSWVPGVGGKGINIPQIPRLAKGGVLNKATLNIAGEAGKEAVVPLEKNTGWINDFIKLFNENGGGNGGSRSQVIQVMMPNGKVLAEVVHEEDKKSFVQNNGGDFAWNT